MGHTSSDIERVQEIYKQNAANAASEIVPWFFEQMPPHYFRDIDPDTQLQHLSAAITLLQSGVCPRLRVKSKDKKRITYVQTEDRPGMLKELMRDFGDELIHAVKLYVSKDKRLVIDTFHVGESTLCDMQDEAIKAKLDAVWELVEGGEKTWTREALAEHFAQLAHDYVLDCPATRIWQHANMVRQVQESGGAAIALERIDGQRSRITCATSNIPAKRMLTRMAQRLATRKVNIARSYVDTISAGEEESVVIVSAVVYPADGHALDPDGLMWGRLRRDILRLKWLEPSTLTLGYNNAAMGLGGADIVHTYCDLTHQLLVKRNRYVYSRARIREIAEQHIGLSQSLVDLFWDRFDPEGPLSDEAYADREASLLERIRKEVEDGVEATVLRTMVGAVGHTLKTNYFVVGRYALALRLAPEAIMEAGERPEKPYGLFWVHGRDFNGFQLRFRDTARGGVRVVRPRSQEQFVRETGRHLDEVYNLAYAQQQKNKDIPESGSKAVVLVRPGQTITRCVRAFADSLLDLITTEEATKARVVDRYGKPEWIYLGPDENITPAHIAWIVQRAEKRGYRYPSALMSSKAGAGINHKEFGVTSEGVNVFLEEALKFVGIDPRKQRFTVKITGGPDGDVAGNEMKILYREYGDNAAVVGVADGFGCAEDPAGLDRAELTRLVEASLPISEFNPEKLSPEGKVILADNPDGIRARNELHDRVVADAFVPAGGRPETINARNWQRYLQEDGTPSSKVIVEGANLFLTAEAREKLFEAGVIVVKDSSANKCGVICSSYEIVASLTVDEEEFVAIKPGFVKQVITHLHRVARLEARLLFAEHRRSPKKSPVELSIRASREINRFKDAIAQDFDKLESRFPEIVHDTVLEHIPSVLIEAAGDRIWQKLPKDYRKRIVCARIASTLVYREGFDYFRDMSESELAELAIRYVHHYRKTMNLVKMVRSSGMENADEVARLLKEGGAHLGLRAPVGA